MELITPAAPADSAGEEITLSYEEFRARCEDLDALQAALQRIADVEAASRQRLEQAAAALGAPLPDGPQASRACWPSGNDAAQHAARQTQTPTAPLSSSPRP